MGVELLAVTDVTENSLEEFRRPSRQPLDPFRRWRMGREQAAEAHPT